MMQTFMTPSHIVYGEHAIDALGPAIQGKGTKALIVTDNFMVRSGVIKHVTDSLDAAQLAYVVFDEVNAEPTDIVVNNGLKVYQEQQCDFFIALGGGSPMDTAKAIAVLTVCPGKLSDYMGKAITADLPYIAAIPTTAGTGSEATKNTIIADTATNVKMLLGGPSLIPDLAIVDPTFTMTVPPKVTAATGIDALTHCIEAYTSRKAQPMTDIFALSAIQRIHRNLAKCFHNGQDVEARLEMAVGALEAGIAFTNASVTIVHGMSRPIGALFHIAHGVSNAILLPECMKFAITENTARFATIARVMGVAKCSTDDETAARAFVQEIIRLCKEVEIPTLAELGVTKEEFYSQIDKMATDALISGSPQNTMRVPTKEDLVEIYQKLY